MLSLDQLFQMFVGKNVRVSHPTVPTETSTGVCCDVLNVSADIFIVSLTNGRRFAVMPEVISEASIEGRITQAGLTRRKIEIIS